MSDDALKPHDAHSVFRGADPATSERRTGTMIWLCGAVMVVEIAGGYLSGSIALVADGLQMTTDAGAPLLAALAARFAGRSAQDGRFTSGTGKLGAGVLATIALLLAWQALGRLYHPQPIAFAAAIPIACLGLLVNLGRAWRFGGGRAHLTPGATVSVLVVTGLVLARAYGWMWMDPAAALVGAVAIASRAWTLIGDADAIRPAVNPDAEVTVQVERDIETPRHVPPAIGNEIQSMSGERVSADGRPRLVGLNHIALEVGDLEAALAFYGRIFAFSLRGRRAGMAFVDMGDQFIALVEGPVRAAPGDRHFGLVVDDRSAVRDLAVAAGAVMLEGPFLDFLDPWGNRVEVVEYRDIQFTKAEPVLRGMRLDLQKSEAATQELRAKGMA